MSEKTNVEEVPMAEVPADIEPGISVSDLLKYGPLVTKIVQAFATGSGTFSTATPMGRRWVRVQDHPFAD